MGGHRRRHGSAWVLLRVLRSLDLAVPFSRTPVGHLGCALDPAASRQDRRHHGYVRPRWRRGEAHWQQRTSVHAAREMVCAGSVGTPMVLVADGLRPWAAAVVGKVSWRAACGTVTVNYNERYIDIHNTVHCNASLHTAVHRLPAIAYLSIVPEGRASTHLFWATMVGKFNKSTGHQYRVTVHSHTCSAS